MWNNTPGTKAVYPDPQWHMLSRQHCHWRARAPSARPTASSPQRGVHRHPHPHPHPHPSLPLFQRGRKHRRCRCQPTPSRSPCTLHALRACTRTLQSCGRFFQHGNHASRALSLSPLSLSLSLYKGYTCDAAVQAGGSGCKVHCGINGCAHAVCKGCYKGAYRPCLTGNLLASQLGPKNPTINETGVKWFHSDSRHVLHPAPWGWGDAQHISNQLFGAIFKTLYSYNVCATGPARRPWRPLRCQRAGPVLRQSPRAARRASACHVSATCSSHARLQLFPHDTAAPGPGKPTGIHTSKAKVPRRRIGGGYR